MGPRLSIGIYFFAASYIEYEPGFPSTSDSTPSTHTHNQEEKTCMLKQITWQELRIRTTRTCIVKLVAYIYVHPGLIVKVAAEADEIVVSCTYLNQEIKGKQQQQQQKSNNEINYFLKNTNWSTQVYIF